MTKHIWPFSCWEGEEVTVPRLPCIVSEAMIASVYSEEWGLMEFGKPLFHFEICWKETLCFWIVNALGFSNFFSHSKYFSHLLTSSVLPFFFSWEGKKVWIILFSVISMKLFFSGNIQYPHLVSSRCLYLRCLYNAFICLLRFHINSMVWRSNWILRLWPL